MPDHSLSRLDLIQVLAELRQQELSSIRQELVELSEIDHDDNLETIPDPSSWVGPCNDDESENR